MTTTPEERRAANDKRVADDIAKYGCHVVSGFDPEEKQPAFTYSIGIFSSLGLPEAIVFGARSEMGRWMVNEYYRQLHNGVRYQRGIQYDGYLEGFNIYVEPLRTGASSEYTFGCDRYYKGGDYPVVQLIYPTTKGLWPWESEASDWFRSNQPMLGRKFPNRR